MSSVIVTEQAGLLRAVLEKPADDAPRLVYADWLDDHDQADRATFIRLQVEMEHRQDDEEMCPVCRHNLPESQLGPVDPNNRRNCVKGHHWTPKYHQLKKITQGMLMGADGQCCRCDWHAPLTHADGPYPCAWEYKRGFIHYVNCTLDMFMGDHPEEYNGLVWPLFRCQPVTNVVIMDVVDHIIYHAGYWWDEQLATTLKMKDGPYENIVQAYTGLNAAVLRFGRRSAQLPALTPN